MTHPPLRVLHVTTNTYVIRSFVINDLIRLRDRTDATIVCADDPEVPALRQRGLQIVTLPIRRQVSPFVDLISIWHLWRLMRKRRFDVLHTYVPKGGLVGQIAGWLARVPNRLHSCLGLSYTPGMPHWRRWLVRSTDRLTNALAQRTLFVSQADFDYATKGGLCDIGSARHIGNGIALADFDPQQLPEGIRDRTREEMGVAKDAPLVLTVGRFVLDKGYRELAEAAATLRRRVPGIRFVWVAPVIDGEEGVLPDTLAVRPDLEGSVIRLPMQQDLRPLYAAADLLAHPSHREGAPRVLMEAAAMGLPIVASDIPGCREVVTDGVTGVLVTPQDADALARLVRAVLQNPTDARRRAKAASKDVRNRFDQDALTERVWEVYEELRRS